jgi:predicted RND superfamily exporter protein
MQKIVIHNHFGDFELSDKARDMLGITDVEERGKYLYVEGRKNRDDPELVRAVEELGKEAGVGELIVVEIPDDVDWIIEEYDGNERISEAHRTWDGSEVD